MKNVDILRIVVSSSFVMLSYVNATLMNELIIPDNVIIKADTCSLWTKTGIWINATSGNTIANFENDCQAATPLDVFIKEPNTNNIWFHTEEKTISFETNIQLHDGESGNIFAYLTENIISNITSIEIVYYFSDDGEEDTRWAESTKTKLFDVSFNVQSMTNVSMATAGIDGLDRLAADFICEDAEWNVQFTSDTIQTQRKAILSAITMKSIRDINRDSDGKVNSMCHRLWWFLIFGLPLTILVCCCSLLLGKIAFDNRTNINGDRNLIEELCCSVNMRIYPEIDI
jgi:hypothetical protein